MTNNQLTIKEKDIRKQGELDHITHFSSGIAVVKEGKVLIIRREPNDFLGGNYELPGGGIEENETFLEGITRELEEETGLQIKEVVNLFEGFDYSTEIKGNVRQINFLVRTDTYNVTLSHEHDAFLWIGIDELQNIPMTEKMKICLQKTINMGITMK